MNIECAVSFEAILPGKQHKQLTGEGNGGETKHHGSHDSDLLIML